MRCTQCGQIIESTEQASGVPEVMCPACRTSHRRAAASAAAGQRDDQRLTWMLALVAVGAILGSFFMTGWFGFELDPAICYALAAAAGLAAGAVLGRDWTARLVYMPLGVLAAAGALVAANWYTAGRSSVYSIELLIPLGLGALPGFALMIVAGLLLRRRASPAQP